MKLEICVDRLVSARTAVAGGADRIEVCAALDVGGVSPSAGLVEQCVELGSIGVMMMIRPHAGGFCYNPDDVATMRRDIQRARQFAVRGVVFGALTPDGRIDRELCRRLLDETRPLEATFHRAFDLTRNPYEAVDDLMELGFDRLLTSGRKAMASNGATLIKKLVDRAGSRLIVMAGGGVRPSNVLELVRKSGVVEVHASASQLEPADDSGGLDFVQAMRVTRIEVVLKLAQACRQLEASAGPTATDSDEA